ncbi:hypothetical protein [Frigoribacterium sp. CG_9.8]|uniref:hypothetical protein n=1 Tax=Frigoribacterium sp. CG_9.8 TaxID=2787733 RepID=UPI0018CB6710|nr:hypothetical protein [Frigoribacterium sp. CG_9.8]MBG6108877.1 hypothetical protein [Frigoribacterium sp. CG_9.8]
MSNETPTPQGGLHRGDESTDAVEPRPTTTAPSADEPVAAEQANGKPVYDLVEVPPARPSSPSAAEPDAAASGSAAAETPPAATQAPPAATQTPPAATQTGPASTSDEPPPRAATSAASMQTVYVPAPVPPIKKGNRGFGVLIALLSTVVFTGLYALVIATIRAVEVGVFQFDFFGSLAFYTPAIFFFVGFVIVVMLANRASWWSYVLGSLLVGLFVYFGTVATGLLVNNVLGETATEAARLLATALSSPFIIGAALVAREVSMWMGAFISARGRRMKARNIDARETFDSESAARTSEYEKARYGTPEATA